MPPLAFIWIRHWDVTTLSLQVQTVGVLSEEEVVKETPVKDLVVTPTNMGVLLSGSGIDAVFRG
jgi:hypothetical protein